MYSTGRFWSVIFVLLIRSAYCEDEEPVGNDTFPTDLLADPVDATSNNSLLPQQSQDVTDSNTRHLPSDDEILATHKNLEQETENINFFLGTPTPQHEEQAYENITTNFDDKVDFNLEVQDKKTLSEGDPVDVIVNINEQTENTVFILEEEQEEELGTRGDNEEQSETVKLELDMEEHHAHFNTSTEIETTEPIVQSQMEELPIPVIIQQTQEIPVEELEVTETEVETENKENTEEIDVWVEEIVEMQVSATLSATPSPITSINPTLADLDEKIRFNYASERCGAKILESKGVESGSSEILTKSLDSYMLSICHENKSIVIELCEEIILETIIMANLEFFSSSFKDFDVYGSKSYPSPSWKYLASFTAQNFRQKQRFDFEKREVYKFIKIEFTTHYGNEYYCPITLVNVYGHSLLEDLREQYELSQIKLQSFNEKIMNELSATPNSVENKIEKSPEPKLPTTTIAPIPSFQFDETCMDIPDLEDFEDFVQNFEEGSSEQISNVFAELSEHITKLEMRYILISNYLNRVRDSSNFKFQQLEQISKESMENLLLEFGESTSYLSSKIEGLETRVEDVRASLEQQKAQTFNQIVLYAGALSAAFSLAICGISLSLFYLCCWK